MEEDTCPICKRISKNTPFLQRDAQTIDCIVCGKYDISWDAIQVLVNNDDLCVLKQRALSHWLYVSSLGNENSFFVTKEILVKILPDLKPTRADELFNNLIRYIGRMAESPEQLIAISTNRFSAFIGSNGMEGANYVINHLVNKGLVFLSERNSTEVSLNLTPEGWEVYGRIDRGDTNTRIVFMAMEYNKADLDAVFFHFQKAVAATGFDLRKLDDSLRAGLIDDQLRVKIRQSKFVISDLTYKNSGAYWEAGYAEGLGKQVIYLCEKSHWEENKTHFDTNHHTTVIWSLSTIEEDMKKLKATIRTSFPAEAKMEDI